MQVKYYKTIIGSNISLKYTSRKRYKKFPENEAILVGSEEQKSVLLGDGAVTSLKTSVENKCDYVIIEGTRWFVIETEYLNGGQIQLYLQRDVIGENGVTGFVGKIERGYTSTLLRNRKELSLNEVMKKRIPVIPDKLEYGAISVNTHTNEMWGLLYLLKTTARNITIEGLKIEAEDVLSNPEETIYTCEDLDNPDEIICGGDLYFSVSLRGSGTEPIAKGYYEVSLRWKNDYSNNNLTCIPAIREISGRIPEQLIVIYVNTVRTDLASTDINKTLSEACLYYSRRVIDYINGNASPLSSLPDSKIGGNYIENTIDYTTKKYRYNDEYFTYTSERKNLFRDGIVNSDGNQSFLNQLVNKNETNSVMFGNILVDFNYRIISVGSSCGFYMFTNSSVSWLTTIYHRRKLTPSEANQLNLDTTNINLIDEPYVILSIPLFDCTVTYDNVSYDVKREDAFIVFNSIIRDTSGENPILVDAQIYPYAPDMSFVNGVVSGIPIMAIGSTSSERTCSVNILPYIDVKKEYIKRNYVLVSPDKSGRFSFNYYDYTNAILPLQSDEKYNSKVTKIIVKTAYKPFGIISSAVIIPDNDSLVGLQYDTDMRGSSPASNGFQCSLTSNAFETYKRQNSNYQQIFNKQEEELRKMHYVEKVNDITAGVVNTLSATMMGSIGGSQLGELGLGKIFGSKALGAGIGASVAGGTVGGAMAYQNVVNESLRRYEEKLLKERFDLNIGTIKNIPDSLNRVSSFNEIIAKEFYFVIEVYECSPADSAVADTFINLYGYGLGVFDFLSNYTKNGWFLRSTLIASELEPKMHTIASDELEGGIYLYE